MPSEAKQAKILFHAFLGRIFDFELLSTGGESQNLLIQFAALLGAFNFVLAFILVPRYGLSTQSQAVLAVNAWHDEELGCACEPDGPFGRAGSRKCRPLGARAIGSCAAAPDFWITG